MVDEEFSFWVIVAALAVCASFAWLLVEVFRVEWFRERLLSPDRGTRVVGMAPIAAPAMLLLWTVFRT